MVKLNLYGSKDRLEIKQQHPQFAQDAMIHRFFPSSVSFENSGSKTPGFATFPSVEILNSAI